MHYSKEELDAIKNLDFIQIAEMMGYTFKKHGKSCECKDITGLVVFPHTHSYYNFYTGEHGSIIDFVMNELNLTFPEACANLYEYIDGKKIQEKPAEEVQFSYKRKELKGDLVMPEPNENDRRAFAYLTKTRGIDAAIINKLMKKGKIYEEKSHHNIVFVGTDKDGNCKHGFIRGSIPDKQFRGDIENSDKDYGFSVPGKINHLVVFEAPIDLLSYLTFHPDTNAHLLALGMLSDSPIYKYMEEHPEVNMVSLLLDNDTKGKKAAERFKETLHDRKIGILEDPLEQVMVKWNVKDVNEALIFAKKELQRRKNQAKDVKQNAAVKEKPQILKAAR